MPTILTKADADALQALLDRYREQTVMVGGHQAGKRFDSSLLVRRAAEAIRRVQEMSKTGHRG